MNLIPALGHVKAGGFHAGGGVGTGKEKLRDAVILDESEKVLAR